MKTKIIFTTLVFATIFASCSIPLKYSHPTTKSLEYYDNLYISPVKSDVVGQVNMMTMKQIVIEASEKIKDRDLFAYVIDNPYQNTGDSVDASILSLPGQTAELELRVKDYKKQNSFLLFLFGFVGYGHVDMEFKLIDMKSRELLSSAETRATISDWASGDKQVILPLADAVHNFINQCFDELKDQRKVDKVHTNSQYIDNEGKIVGIPDEYLSVQLNDGRLYNGIILKVNEEKLYLADGKALYIISNKLIATITNDDEKLVLSELQNQEWDGINFNRYKVQEKVTD